MKEFPDDELDKLFRKSSEELDSSFDPSDWNALKKKLDEQDGRTVGSWIKKWWPIGLLTLLIVGGLATYVATKDEETKKPEISQAPEGRTPEGRTPDGRTPIENSGSGKPADAVSEVPGGKVGGTALEKGKLEKEADTASGKSGIESGSGNGRADQRNDHFDKSKKADLVTGSEYKKKLPRRWSKTGGVYLEPDRSIGRGVDGALYSKNNISGSSGNRSKIARQDLMGNKGKPEPDNENKLLNSEERNSQEPGFISRQMLTGRPENVNPVVSEENVPDSGEGKVLISAGLLKSRSLSWQHSSDLPVVKAMEKPVSEAVKPAPEKVTGPRFAVRFGYAPDLSTVGFKNFTKPGSSVSLLVEYAVVPRLYLQSGLIRSSKVYNARAGEYAWPANWYNQKALPTSVDGVCKIIEIPLNIRFDISQNERSRWFAGAGVSSYYMQDEKYEFNYPKHTYNIKSYKTSTGWYWLSHLNASAGYEYRLSGRLSILAEPYVRIPVKKVGFGKVDLFTVGAWFSVRYTPSFK